MVHTHFVATVQDITHHDHPNALCAICLKRGTMRPATAIRNFLQFVSFYVCEGHAERGRRWDRVVAASAEYRRKHAAR